MHTYVCLKWIPYITPRDKVVTSSIRSCKGRDSGNCWCSYFQKFQEPPLYCPSNVLSYPRSLVQGIQWVILSLDEWMNLVLCSWTPCRYQFSQILKYAGSSSRISWTWFDVSSNCSVSPNFWRPLEDTFVWQKLKFLEKKTEHRCN